MGRFLCLFLKSAEEDDKIIAVKAAENPENIRCELYTYFK